MGQSQGDIQMREGAIFFTLINQSMLPLIGIVMSFPLEKVGALSSWVPVDFFNERKFFSFYFSFYIYSKSGWIADVVVWMRN